MPGEGLTDGYRLLRLMAVSLGLLSRPFGIGGSHRAGARKLLLLSCIFEPRKFSKGNEVSGPAIALQKIVDPRTCSLQFAVWRRHIGLKVFDPACGPSAFVNSDPNTRLVDNLALAVVRPTTRPVAQILGAGLRANVFRVADDTISAGLAAEQRRFDGEFEALHRAG